VLSEYGFLSKTSILRVKSRAKHKGNPYNFYLYREKEKYLLSSYFPNAMTKEQDIITKPAKILIVDDEADILDLLEYNFKQEGYAVIRAMVENDHERLRSLALDHGFYDQAHFIHDFRKFVAMEPGRFLRDESQFLRTYLGNASRLHSKADG